jgi:phage protein D/phage baseplate assembly protein gpV
MPHGEEFSNTVLVKVNGTPLPDDVKPLLVGGYVDDSSNVPDLFVLRFSDEAGIVLQKAGAEIGAKVELSLQSTSPGGPAVLLAAEVTAIEVDISEAGVHTVVRGLDASHRLFRGTRIEAYVNMTASDIVREVAQRVGLTCGTVDATTTTLEHTTQDNVNDWDFLRRLGAEHDRLLTMSDGKLQFVSRTPASEAPSGSAGARNDPLVLERGVSLVNLRGTITSDGQVQEVEVRGWDPEQKKEVVAKKEAATESAVPEGGITPTALAAKFSAPPYVLGRASLAKQEEVTSVATSLADHLAGGFAELEGTARGNPALRAGTAVQLVGVSAPFAGKYVLTSTRHEFAPEFGYRTLFSASNASERSLFGTAGAAATRARPELSGVVPAIVTSVQDPEHRGRVKIKLPWLADTYESWWARTVQPGAGEDRGAAVLPEVGDEVLVAFEQGDLGHPYILGGLYNGKDVPHGGWAANVDGTSGKVVRRGLVSRTGMKVDFLEAAGSEAIEISSNDGAQKVVLTQTGSKGIEILSEGPLTVKAMQAVEVTTDTGNLKIKAVNVDIEAQANLNLKAGVNAELSGSALAAVKGALVKIN